jgi:hypothetical protein
VGTQDVTTSWGVSSAKIGAVEALIGIALGAGLAWLSAAYGQRRAQRAEHDKWLRERRFEAWTEMLSACETMWHFRTVIPPEEQRAEQSKLRDTIAQMTLLGPGTVISAARKLHNACTELGTSEPADEKKALDKAVSDAHDDFVKVTMPYMRPTRRAGRWLRRGRAAGQAWMLEAE